MALVLGTLITSSGGGGGGTSFLGSYTTFADLPSASSNANKIALVKTSTGVFFVNRNPKGTYISDGTNWVTGEFPTEWIKAAKSIGTTSTAQVNIGANTQTVSLNGNQAKITALQTNKLIKTNSNKELTSIIPTEIYIPGNISTATNAELLNLHRFLFMTSRLAFSAIVNTFRVVSAGGDWWQLRSTESGGNITSWIWYKDTSDAVNASSGTYAFQFKIDITYTNGNITSLTPNKNV